MKIRVNVPIEYLEDEDLETEKQCRICLCGVQEGQFLVMDCRCRGGMQTVHVECISQQMISKIKIK